MTRRWWIAGVAGEVLFTADWLAAGFWQGSGYRPVRDDISDMGALTASHAWLFLVPLALSGLAVIAFALFALRPAVRGAGPWFAAGSALQNLLDPFFRLDCRAADGCSMSQATASWHGSLHAALSLICVLLLAGAPFMLARAFRSMPGWQRLAAWSRWAGMLVAAGLVAEALGPTAPVHGLLQRLIAAVSAGWGVAIALRLRATSTRISAKLSAEPAG